MYWVEQDGEAELIGQDAGGLIHGGALDCGGMRRRKSSVPVEQNGQMLALGLVVEVSDRQEFLASLVQPGRRVGGMTLGATAVSAGVVDVVLPAAVECGVGSNWADFDRLKIHTFPGASKKPIEIWPLAQDVAPVREPSEMILDAVKATNDCGVLAYALENKSISASFVGAAAGAMVVGELLRALHSGCRCELQHAQLRSIQNKHVFLHLGGYGAEMARTGFVKIARSRTKDPSAVLQLPLRQPA